MKRSVQLAVLCLGTGLALTATAQAQQQFDRQQMGQQTFGQQQFGQPGQMAGQQQQQQLTEQNIRNFFDQAEGVLQRTARTQDPEALRQYLSQTMAPEAVITTVTELYLRDRLIATTIAEATDETVTDALGHAASALQGRKLVSDYGVEINIRDIQIMPGGQSARVRTAIREQGLFGGPAARRVAERMGQARERIGELRQQFQQDQGQWGQGQQMGQPGQQSQQQGWGQMQGDQSQQGMGMGAGPGRGGAPEQGIPFQTQANCTHEVILDRGQIRIGNTFCRGMTRLG